MELLKQLFSEEEINEILEQNEDVKKLTKEELKGTLKFIADLMDHNNQKIRRIIQMNPEVLSRTKEEMDELVEKLNQYHFKDVAKMIDEYPYFLNKDAYEIDGYFIRKRKNGISLEDAAIELEKDSYKIEL